MSRIKVLDGFDNSELSPCKCGAKPEMMVWYIKGVVNRRNYAVVCPKCGHRLKEPYKFSSPEKAIAFWNKEAEC